MIIRTRSRFGLWRHDCQPSTTFSEFISGIERERKICVNKIKRSKNGYNAEISKNDPATLDSLGLQHGDILIIDTLDDTAIAVPSELDSRKGCSVVIDETGNIVPAKNVNSKQAFRPGLQSLRQQKLHWTWTDVVEFDKEFTFELRGNAKASFEKVECESRCLDNFQRYLRTSGFQEQRCAYLYGNIVFSEASRYDSALCFEKNLKVTVEDLENQRKKEARNARPSIVVRALYEPLQQSSSDGFELLEDSNEERVNIVAKGLGLRKVGFMFSHPPGREGYRFTTHELVNAGEQALEVADKYPDSPFVVLCCTATSDEKTPNALAADFQAYALTSQVLEMISSDALLKMPEYPGHSSIDEKFALVVEKKHCHVADNDFFIMPVRIKMHDKSLFVGRSEEYSVFRDNSTNPSSCRIAFKKLLGSSIEKLDDYKLAEKLGDFNLLVYLSSVFALDEEITAIVEFVASHLRKDPSPKPLDKNHRMVISKLAEAL